MDGDGAEAEPAVLHAAQADLLHEGGEGGRGEEAIHRLRQIGVRLAVAAHDGPDPGHDVVEVGAEERRPARQVRLGDLEGDHASARPRHAAHLAQALVEIGEVAEEEGGGDEGEGPGLEGQGEGIRFHEPDAGRRLLRAALEARDGQHAVGEVGAHQRAMPMDLAQLEREVSRARGEVEARPVRRGNGLARRRPPPRVVHTKGHEPIHEVVPPRDAREHLAHEARLARSLPELHAHSTRPPRTAAKRITEMYPFTLKKATSSRDRSSGETSECSYMNSAATATTPSQKSQPRPVMNPRVTKAATVRRWQSRAPWSAAAMPKRAGKEWRRVRRSKSTSWQA